MYLKTIKTPHFNDTPYNLTWRSAIALISLIYTDPCLALAASRGVNIRFCIDSARTNSQCSLIPQRAVVLFTVSSTLYSNRLRDLSALREGASRVNYKITLCFWFFFLFPFSFGLKTNKKWKKKKINFHYLYIYNTRLSWKSLQQLRISLQHLIFTPKSWQWRLRSRRSRRR